MLNILKKLKKFNNNPVKSNNISLNLELVKKPVYPGTKQDNYDEIVNYHKSKEYNNLIYRPTSTKEWFGSIYSFNKSYIKPLIVYNVNLNKLFISYFNMILYKIKILYKRRRHNKSRYSANRVYVSRAELKHTNSKITILLYTYNKQKISLERYLKKIIMLIRFYKIRKENQTKLIVSHKRRISKIIKLYTVYKKLNIEKSNGRINRLLVTFTNRLVHLIKDNLMVLKR